MNNLVERHVSPLQRKIRGPVLAELERELTSREVDPGAPEQLVTHVLRMKQVAEDKLAAATALDARWDHFTRRYFRKPDERSRRQVLSDYIAETAADEPSRRADLAALERFLDYDTMLERHLTERHDLLVAVELAITFIGNAGVSALENAAARNRDQLAREMFTAGGLVQFLCDIVESKARWQIRRCAIEGLIGFANDARTRDRDMLGKLRKNHMGTAVRIATDPDDQPFVQSAAIQLAMVLSPELAFDLISKRCLEPSAHKRDFLVRRQCVDLLATVEDSRALDLLRKILEQRDASEHVRQGLAEAFAKMGSVSEVAALAHRDPSPRVRAVAIRAACRAKLDPSAVLTVVTGLLTNEADPLPLLVACDDVIAVAEKAHGNDVGRLLDALLAVASHPRCSPGVQETAAAAAERVSRSGDSRAWRDYLVTVVQQIAPGKSWSTRLSRLVELPELPDEPEFLGRMLAELSRRDFPLSASRVGDKLVIWRGDRYRRRLWRILHEMRSPRPNKRQAHRHTVGRHMRGHFRAPPGLLDEVTATVVPGERVLVAEEGGWGRHVPTVDDLLDLPLWSGEAVRVFSSFGVTTIRPPSGFFARLRNKLALSSRYETVAAMRLASLAGVEPHVRGKYAEELRDRYGIEITFERYDYAHKRALAPARLEQVFASSDGEPVERLAEQAS